MSGYRLSPRAAEAEARALSNRLERKEITPIVSGWRGLPEGGADGQNFETNRVTVQQFQDVGADVQGGAIGMTATWACTNFWAGNIAALPCGVYRTGAGGVAVEDRGHSLSWLLHTSPNADQSAFDFWEFMVASIELRGNAYAEISRRGDGSIIALTPIMPDQVTPARGSNREIVYTCTDQPTSRKLAQGDMLHVRGPLGTPLGGMSPLTVLRRTFQAAMATERAANGMFSKGALPSGIMTKEGEPLTKPQRELLEQLLQEKFVGAANAGRPMLLDGGLKWTQIAMTADDMQMLESRYFGLEEICRAFEVDPHLVGHTHGNTTLGSSITDQTNSVMKFKMRKRLKRIEGAVEKQILTRADHAAGVSIKFNVEAFLRADSIGRSEYYDNMKPFMTINEVRKLEGLPPVPGGDVIYKQMQDIAITDKAPAPGAGQ